MIWTKLVFGGFGRRGLEAVVAVAVLAIAAAIVAGALMVIEGAKAGMARAEREDRPDIIQVKSRFNRALFETPRSGKLPPLTLPVYEPLIDPGKLSAGGGTVIARQSLLRNVVSGDSFLNVYIFGIEPEKEPQVSVFSVGRGRFLRADDAAVAILDQASAEALGVDLGGSFPVRKADGQDLSLTVVGILDRLQLRYPPPRTIAAPVLTSDSNYVSSGVFVTLRTSEEIFGRSTLTDAIVVAPAPQDVPSVVDGLREAFRLAPGVFITERYGQFRRKVHDFAQTLALFTIISAATATLAGSFAANLLHDVYADRRRQYAMLLALGFSPLQTTIVGIAIGIAAIGAGTLIGALVALTCSPNRFAMPSLMADLGAIEPRFDLLIAAIVIGIALAAVTLGMAPTAWWLHRRVVGAGKVKASSVVVRSVTKTYRRGLRSITALKDVSFEMSQGELALFVGPSGSGKTTLLNLIAALDRPDRGNIIVDGSEITGLSRSAAPRYRNERVGFIFQSYNLLPQLTALENILLPMLPKRRSDRRRAAELLGSVGLGDRSSHRPAELSGGEQQRVAIARALANDPALILADEPTGNLDDDNARKIAELLSRTCRERGKTLILVTHDRQMIRPVDRVFEMRDGSLTLIESVLAS